MWCCAVFQSQFSHSESCSAFLCTVLWQQVNRSLSACSEHNIWAGAMHTSQPAMWWHRNGWVKVVPGPPLPCASMNRKMVSPLLQTGVQGDLGHITHPFQRCSHEQTKVMSSAHKSYLVMLSSLSPPGDSLPTKEIKRCWSLWSHVCVCVIFPGCKTTLKAVCT